MEVSTTIGERPAPSLLLIGMTDKATGQYRQVRPAELSFYDDSVLLAGKLKIIRGRVNLVSRGSTPLV